MKKYKKIKIYGQIDALFSEHRIPQFMLPKGLYKYDISYSGWGPYATVKKFVIPYYKGTLITRGRLNPETNYNAHYHLLTISDDNCSSMTLKEFLADKEMQ